VLTVVHQSSENSSKKNLHAVTKAKYHDTKVVRSNVRSTLKDIFVLPWIKNIY